MRRLPSIATFAVFATGFTAPVGAHDFCVDTSAAIQGALTAAQANGEDDNIFIQAGHYLLKTDLTVGLTFSSTEAHSIALFGGYDDVSSCPPIFTPSILAGAGTTLDGELAVRPLLIQNANGDVSINELAFASGTVTGNGGGLNIGAASLSIALSRFYANHAAGPNGEGGGVFAVALSGPLYFTNNLVFDNHGTKAGGAELYQGGGNASVTFNTIVQNFTDTLSEPGGLRLYGAATFAVSNNIIWNNHDIGGSDFGVFSANTRSTNDIGVITPGSTSAGFTSDLSVDPDFLPCGGPCLTFQLKFTSPLVDVGTGSPHGFDLAGNYRWMGSKPDIGAFENAVIFADGFE